MAKDTKLVDLTEIENDLVVTKMEKFRTLVEVVKGKQGGKFTTTDIVSSDSKKKEILEWNDKVAGNLWRHHEVTVLLHKLDITMDGKARKAYYNIVHDEGRHYYFLPDILRNEELLDSVVEDYRRRLDNLNEQFSFLEQARQIQTLAKTVFVKKALRKAKKSA